MELKLRLSYILLAISIVVLAIGITLIVIHSTPDGIAEPPAIKTLVDRTVVVQAGQPGRFDFNVPRTGVLKVTVEVISGGIIDFSIYEGSTLWWNGEEGDDIIRSSFEVPIDTGTYRLFIPAPKYWWEGGSSETSTVRVYLAFEG